MSPLVGRTTETKKLAGLVLEGRLLMLCGAPGIGKSRLALAAVEVVESAFAEGVIWVDLAEVGSDGALAAVAAAVCGREDPGGDPAATIVATIGPGRTLLVIDNCEHVVGSCAALVATLLASCPELTVLATGREPLAIDGERRWWLPPMSATEAVELFYERAGAAQMDFVAGEKEAVAILEICALLEGIPLAIELAAGRVGVLTTPEILVQLQHDPLAVLAGAGHTLGRNDSMRGALDSSYDLLDGSERALFRRLAVFSGGATLAAAQAVCAGPSGRERGAGPSGRERGAGPSGRERGAGASVAPDDVLEVMASLVGKSLVVARTDGPEARYNLLGTIRQYAGERLDEARERPAMLANHMEWCLGIVETNEAELTGANQPQALARIDSTVENLRAAYSRALETDGDDALRLASALTLWWRVRGRFDEGRGWLEAALDRSPDAPALLRAKALWGAGFLAHMVGDHASAFAYLEESLGLFDDAGDAQGQARALLLYGNAAASTGEGLQYLEESVEFSRRAGDEWCLVHALSLAGRVHLDAGRPVDSRKLLEEAVCVARRSGDLQGLRISLHLLGYLSLSQGDANSAETLLTEALGAIRALGDVYGVAAVLHLLGELAYWRRDYDKAEELLAEALQLALEIHTPSLISVVFTHLGQLELSRGRLALAAASFDAALHAVIHLGMTSSTALLGLGLVKVAEGDPAGARPFLEEATNLVRGKANPTDVAAVTGGLAELAGKEGHVDRAIALWRKALGVWRDAGNARAVADALEALGGVAAGLGMSKAKDAARLFGAAETVREATACGRHPVQEERFEADLASVRSHTSPELFEAAWAEGAAMSPDDAVAAASWGRPRRPATGWPSLTAAEKEVVRLVAEGLSNREIGERLYISRNTVQTHVAHIFAKLSISSRAKLARESALRAQAGEDTAPKYP